MQRLLAMQIGELVIQIAALTAENQTLKAQIEEAKKVDKPASTHKKGV